MTNQFYPFRTILACVVDEVSVDRLGGARHDRMFVLLDFLGGTFAGTKLRLGGFSIEDSVVVYNHALHSRILGGDYLGQLYAIIFREYIALSTNELDSGLRALAAKVANGTDAISTFSYAISFSFGMVISPV